MRDSGLSHNFARHDITNFQFCIQAEGYAKRPDIDEHNCKDHWPSNLARSIFRFIASRVYSNPNKVDLSQEGRKHGQVVVPVSIVKSQPFGDSQTRNTNK